MRGVRKIQSATQQPREPGFVLNSLTAKKLPRKETLWAEISAELKFQPFDVGRWFES